MTTAERVTYAAGGFDPDAAGGNVADRATVTVPVEAVNADVLHAAALAALNTNRKAIAAVNPTTAQVVQQVKTLSAQNNALIRLVLGLLDATG